MDLTKSDFEKILYYYQMLCLRSLKRKAQSVRHYCISKRKAQSVRHYCVGDHYLTRTTDAGEMETYGL